MKATFDIPDELYRSVKARSALEGRPLRSVAVELFKNWLNSVENKPASTPASVNQPIHKTRFDDAPWVSMISPYIRPDANHDLDAMRDAIARGWGDHAAGKLTTRTD